MTKFQSSPALKDRCNVYRDYRVRGGYEFQSSPALKDRCNSSVQRGGRHFSVSILTGLERPVQRMCERLRHQTILGFNPHRP